MEGFLVDQMSMSSEQIQARITLRPAVSPGDDAFLQELYASTRDDLSGVIHDQAELRQLLVMQYNGQKATYSAEFPRASHDIVLLDGEPVGRLIVDRRSDAIHGVDLAILNTYRNLGVGTIVLSNLFQECSEKGLRFIFSVEKTNRAARLYQRLGCRIHQDMGTHFSMIWTPLIRE
ncbi:MAG TPA: GNAT family N-acetyltransferase [Pyrinomonadaceae bacterium]|nr:GNAT family N-acetyltransferase [Pyrinomonadaceae bacterium]